MIFSSSLRTLVVPDAAAAAETPTPLASELDDRWSLFLDFCLFSFSFRLMKTWFR